MKFSKAIWSALTLTSALVILFLTTAAWAQSSSTENNQLVCGPCDVAVAELVGDFGEQIIGRGLSENGKAMLEVFKSETGSWTIITTDTKGISCVVSSGKIWMQTQNPDNNDLHVKH